MRLLAILPTYRVGLNGIGKVAGARYAILDDRGILAVKGPDARPFLQGLISNDVAKVTPDRAIHAALLTPQGKYLFDFFVVQHGDQLLLDAERARLPALLQKLMLYRLRSKVELSDVTDKFQVAVIFGDDAAKVWDLPDTPGISRALDTGVAMVDPRSPKMGLRAILPAATAEESLRRLEVSAGDLDAYEILRLKAAVPDGSRDLIIEKSTLLESNFDTLNGVDFKKGCFVGQELTARMKYRGLVRKRLLPVRFEGQPPAFGAVIKAGEREIGEMRSASRGHGIALLRLDRLKEAKEAELPLIADGVELQAEISSESLDH